MRELIGRLAGGDPPATVLLTSHNLAEVEELCGRVAVISRGRIRALDAPRNLRAAHRQHERVRLTLAGVEPGHAASLLRGAVPRAEASGQAGAAVLSFEREVGDDLLDRALRALAGGGATVLACEAERGTLLDVLETFEREGEEDARGARA
jgi:ABC-2 type transport system ATP-binding protein